MTIWDLDENENEAQLLSAEAFDTKVMATTRLDTVSRVKHKLIFVHVTISPNDNKIIKLMNHFILNTASHMTLLHRPFEFVNVKTPSWNKSWNKVPNN